MIEIPEDVEQWTYGKIVDLIDEGYDENDILEFKQQVNLDAKRLCQSACAFVNTNGGTILFGIDNDRTKPLHLHDRIIGLDDSDQLKRQIVDKINNIHPNIPIENLKFKKANVRLPNKKVIVILKIEKSKLAPHEYEKLFYKRISDGNDPMNAEEIKYIILENHKKQNTLELLVLFGGLLVDVLMTIKIHAENNNISSCIFWLRDLDFNEFEYFMANETYLYKRVVLNSFTDLIFRLRRLTTMTVRTDNDGKWLVTECETIIKVMHDIEKLLNIEYSWPINPTSISTQKDYDEEKKKESKKSKS